MTGHLRLVPAGGPDTTPSGPAAVIYLSMAPEADLAVWRERCFAHCVREGYSVKSVITGGVEAWDHVLAAVRSGEADVVVIGRREHLPSDRTPRVEEAGVPATVSVATAARSRRARRTRRRDSGAGAR